jgi:hypothetical protein
MPVVRFASTLYNELKYEIARELADTLANGLVGTINTVTGLADIPANQVVAFAETVNKIDRLLEAGGYSNAV